MTPAQSLAATAHDFSFTTLDGQPLPLKSFAGQVVLVVNTASRCGFTPQYTALQTLWETYRDRGLIVLGVPSNDFGGQEPGTASEIKSFCEINFRVNFPLTAKEVVSGNQAHPFYRWVADQVGILGLPRWNFYKYVIAPDGRLVAWFSSLTSPESSGVRAAIEAVLPPP